MSVSFFYISALLLSLSSVTALECYGCVSTTSSDCYHGPVDSFFHQTCPPQDQFDRTVLPILNLLPIEVSCVQYVHSAFGQDVIERGCGYMYHGVDICDYLNQTGTIQTCQFCTTDYCNSKLYD